MARFCLTVQGGRGQASRYGSAKSGAVATIAGWNVGVRVTCTVDENGDDQIDVYATGGSNGTRIRDRIIATLKDVELATVVEVFPPESQR